MMSFGESAADDEPELADVGRLARKLVRRAVRTARAEDQPLRRMLLDHLGAQRGHTSGGQRYLPAV